MRLFFIFLAITQNLISSPYSGYEISYGGMSIQCDEGCGDDEDPDLIKIRTLFSKYINSVFGSCTVLDDSLQTRFVSPWGKNVPKDEFEYVRWDWKSTDGFLPTDYCSWKAIDQIPHQTFYIATYTHFLEASQPLIEDVYFYYVKSPKMIVNNQKELLAKIKEIDREEYRFIYIDSQNEFHLLKRLEWPSKHRKIEYVIEEIEQKISDIEANQLSQEKEYYEKTDQTEKIIDKIDRLFRHMFLYCLQNHQIEGASFHTALEQLLLGDYDKALSQIQFLIDFCEKNGSRNELISKLLLLKGQLQSEYSLYSDAIIGLTTAIQKNPVEKEAYFERAKAYFELGKFDNAIEDFLNSGFTGQDPNYTNSWEQFSLLSKGITTGLIEGTSQAAIEFIPETLSTLRGMGNCLWAFSTDPIGISKSFTNAAIECIQYIKNNTNLQNFQNIVPELKKLAGSYDELPEFEKGKLIGQILGKYGTDILLCKSSISAIKAYRNLKKANELTTLEALASSKTRKTILEGAEKCLDLNKKILSKERTKLKGNCLNEIWHKGTFQDNSETIIYHLKKHGKGRSAVQYTQDAMSFFETNKQKGVKVILRDGTPGIKIQIQALTEEGLPIKKIGGYWTENGKLVTYWD